MIRKILKRAGFGFLLGIAICAVITALRADPVPASEKLIEKMGSARAAILLQLFLSGIYGACCMGFTMLYEMERLSVTVATFLHCVICVGPFIPLSLLLHWSGGIRATLIMTGCQMVAFFIIWLIIYLGYRKETRELNEIQKKLLEKGGVKKEDE